MPATDLTITTTADDRDLVTTVAGAVDVTNAYRIPDRVAAALADSSPRPATVVIDLSGVTFLDSTGLSMLLRAEDEVRAESAALVLRNPSESVRRILAITALDSHFTVR